MRRWEDVPLWVVPVMAAVIWVMIANQPEVVREARAVRLDQIPYRWFGTFVVVQMVMYAIGFEVYEWFGWEWEERRHFLRMMLIVALIVVASVATSILLSTAFSWNYEVAVLLSLVPLILWAAIYRLRRPKEPPWS